MCFVLVGILGFFGASVGMSIYPFYAYVSHVAVEQQRVAEIDTLANARDLGCLAQPGDLPSGYVFLSCDVLSTPNLTDVPELGLVRSLLSPRAESQQISALKVDASIWESQNKVSTFSNGHQISKCVTTWYRTPSNGCSGETGPRWPENVTSKAIAAAASSIDIGSASSAYLLSPSLRDKLIERGEAWTPMAMTKRNASESYSPEQPILSTSKLTVEEDGEATTVSADGKKEGDMKITVNGLLTEKVTVFALVQDAVPQADEAYFKVANGKQAKTFYTWPRSEDLNGARLDGKRVLLTESLPSSPAYVLNGAYTKEEAVKKIRDENPVAGGPGFGMLFVSFFGSVLINAVASAIGTAMMSKDRLSLRAVQVYAYFAVTGTIAIANMVLIISHFFVQASYVPLIVVGVIFCICFYFRISPLCAKVGPPVPESEKLEPLVEKAGEEKEKEETPA